MPSPSPLALVEVFQELPPSSETDTLPLVLSQIAEPAACTSRTGSSRAEAPPRVFQVRPPSRETESPRLVAANTEPPDTATALTASLWRVFQLWPPSRETESPGSSGREERFVVLHDPVNIVIAQATGLGIGLPARAAV